jgi:hypothetical protein
MHYKIWKILEFWNVILKWKIDFLKIIIQKASLLVAALNAVGSYMFAMASAFEWNFYGTAIMFSWGVLFSLVIWGHRVRKPALFLPYLIVQVWPAAYRITTVYSEWLYKYCYSYSIFSSNNREIVEISPTLFAMFLILVNYLIFMINWQIFDKLN